ncbi:hypothetical protein GUJ93_ZPchr0001g31706 [Zizania palustris]|uniref:Secreted protein n=1 Tax=Zizania palustris TaxID=103762 RepID=A0A8J5RZB4_ZIZPA|nr:hypothetical protein GUJ93_ZPchr0001g31706 [Zizania palustris]
MSSRAAACGALILQTTAAASPVSRNDSVDQRAGRQRRKAVSMTAAAAERCWTGWRSGEASPQVLPSVTAEAAQQLFPAERPCPRHCRREDRRSNFVD